MDAIDRFQSGLFVRHVNVNTLARHDPFAPADFFSQGPYARKSIAQPNSQLEIAHTQHTPETPLPLLSVSLEVDIDGRLCTTTLTQKFTNASAHAAQDARYLFPVYNGSVVTSFRCWVGPDRLLEGAVKPKNQARGDFQQAVSRHKAAVLIEEVTPEILETRIGNIPAQTTVKVALSYTTLLKVDNSTGGLILNIPTSVAPRYGIPPVEFKESDPLPTEGLRINVQASMPASIRKMESGTHPISVEIGTVSHKSFQTFVAGASSETFDPSKARASLADRSAVLHKDFILHIILSSPREFMQSQAIATSQPDNPSHSTAVITINPGQLFLQGVNTEDFHGEIIFMADRSGSMGAKIPSLINVMNVFLRSLPQKCSFNIASFGSTLSWLWPTSRTYNQEQLDAASLHVESFQANLGGTEILQALHSAIHYHDRRVDVPTNVILLTDGEVWDVDQVIAFAKTTASSRELNVRFFALGIGDRVSHRLVEGIGQQGGGCAEIVAESSSAGAWQERVIQMLKAALTPNRLQCEVDFGQLPPVNTNKLTTGLTSHHLTLPPYIQAPHQIPTLNAFSHISLYYMLNCALGSLPSTVTVTAVTDKGERLSAQLQLQKPVSSPGLHHLAAKALMNDYEIGQSWMHAAASSLDSNDSAMFERTLEEEAQRLGQKWSITSKWTSYVAIDRGTAQHHEISFCKADSFDISELTRPRRFEISQPRLRLTGPRSMVLGQPQAYKRFESECTAIDPTVAHRIFQSVSLKDSSRRRRGRKGPPPSFPRTSIPAQDPKGNDDCTVSDRDQPSGSPMHGIANSISRWSSPQASERENGATHRMRSSASEPNQFPEPPREPCQTLAATAQSYPNMASSPFEYSDAIDTGYWSTSTGVTNSNIPAYNPHGDADNHGYMIDMSGCGYSTESAPMQYSPSPSYSAYCPPPYGQGAIPDYGSEQGARNPLMGGFPSSSTHIDNMNSLPNYEPLSSDGIDVEFGVDKENPRSTFNIPPLVPLGAGMDSMHLNLWEILRSQAANGEFQLRHYNLHALLVAKFKKVINIGKLTMRSVSTKPTSIQLNILAIVYITTRFENSKNLWELQIAKARQWIRTKLLELCLCLGHVKESESKGQEFEAVYGLEGLENAARNELIDESEDQQPDNLAYNMASTSSWTSE